MHIDYYMFPISPFTYLAGTRLEALAADKGATVTYKPINLMEVFATTGGTPPAQRHPSRKAYRLRDLARTAEEVGLPITIQPAHFPTNPVPASAAIIGAQAAGGGDLGGLVHGILRACWAEEKNVAEDTVLKDLLSAHGFDPAIADSALVDGAAQYEKNTAEAIERGVFGAPTYAVGEELFWGQDRLPQLARLL